MRIFAAILIALSLPAVAGASDACSDAAIRAIADVTVSDGTSFSIESLYASPDHSSIRHFGDDRDEQIVAVEGPFGWAQRGQQAELGADFHKVFALGHQYHAFLLYPDELLANIRETTTVKLGGAEYAATSGDYPYGGTVHILQGEEHPAGQVFEFEGMDPIEVAFSDWRQVGNNDLPFLVRIDDGERVFDYHYTTIEIGARSPLWFYETLPAPALDHVGIHRLHRKLLAAHCIGDATMMGDLSAASIISANGGELQATSNADLRTRFAALFEALDYQEYEDLAPPVIDVAESGDVGWIAVNVRAAGIAIESGNPFESEWAWIMTARKTDGVWLHAGNASSVKP